MIFHLQCGQHDDDGLAQVRRLEHVDEFVLLMLIRLLRFLDAVDLAIFAELLKVLLADLTAIHFGHAPQAPDGPIDIIPSDQPLGALLHQKIEQYDQQQRQRGAG